MPDYSGFIIRFDEDLRADLLKERGDIQWGFSDTFSAPDWGVKAWEVCFLTFDSKSISFACLGRRGNKAATAKYRVDFSNFVNLHNLPLAQIEASLPVKLRDHFLKSSTGRGKRLTLKTWQHTISIVLKLRQEQSGDIERLLRLRLATTKIFKGPGAETVALEKDAVGLALDIFDTSKNLRKSTLQSWAPETDEMPPFLGCVEDRFKISEEQMLSHDSNHFPNADALPSKLGARFRIGSRFLDVSYFNRTPVERTLGVDLIYYNHFFKSYTLVQYKRMTLERAADNEPESAIFRPNSDASFEKEIQRMAAFRILTPDEWLPPQEWKTYRLNGDGFFFKFCPSISLEALSSDLIKGMYLPREYLESLLLDGVTNGSRSGKYISYENTQRYLNNTEFTNLVQNGWIGTRGVSSDLVSEIVKESLDAKKAVVHATSWESKGLSPESISL